MTMSRCEVAFGMLKQENLTRLRRDFFDRIYRMNRILYLILFILYILSKKYSYTLNPVLVYKQLNRKDRRRASFGPGYGDR